MYQRIKKLGFHLMGMYQCIKKLGFDLRGGETRFLKKGIKKYQK